MSALPVKQPTTSSSQRQQIMKKHSKPRPAPGPGRTRRSAAPTPDEEPSGDSPRPVWDPDRTDIERPNELPDPSIESASRDDEAGGVEAAESVVRKATPFE